MVELVGDRGFVVLGGCEGAPIAIVYSTKVGLLVRVMRYEKMNIDVFTTFLGLQEEDKLMFFLGQKCNFNGS